MKNIVLLFPEIFLTFWAIFILLWGSFYPQGRKSFIYLSLFGLLVTLISFLPLYFLGFLPWAEYWGVDPLQKVGGWIQYPLVSRMISVDSMSVFFKLAVLMCGILVFLISIDYEEFLPIPMAVYSFLLLISTVGMMILVGSIDFLLAVIALELSGIPLFILIGFILKKGIGTEGAIKFFLVSTFSTGLLLLGISYYYGYFGTTNLVSLLSLGRSPDLGLSLTLILLLAGFGFKIAVVPFHMWAPDAYEAAPTPVTAFLSVAPKVATLGFLLRVFYNHQALRLNYILAALAAITMTVGNIGALKQDNVKRLMAYSSIAQIGYFLAAFSAVGGLNGMGSQALLLYVFIYVFMNLGIFTGLVIVSNQTGEENVPAFRGLAQKSLGLSFLMMVFLLALTGIPPLSGFVGKFAILGSLLKSQGLLWLAILMVLNSVVSFYYYFRIAQEMFFKDAEPASKPLQFPPALCASMAIAFALTFLVGIFPNSLINWIRTLLGS